MNFVEDVRAKFRQLLRSGMYLRSHPDPSGDTVEILNAQFVADEPTIFGVENPDYVARELEWYLSQSLNVHDIPGGPPKIWRRVCGVGGKVNSNYGWCVYSEENGDQLRHCVEELTRNWQSRRACMIYQRPSMHEDATDDGMQDFICTNVVHVHVRRDPVRGERARELPYDSVIGSYEPHLHYSVCMRSNDAVFGYKNDLAWHAHVQGELIDLLKESSPDRFEHLRRAPIMWNAASLHVYRRHFNLVLPKSERCHHQGRE
jgi:thymidylate synthase